MINNSSLAMMSGIVASPRDASREAEAKAEEKVQRIYRDVSQYLQQYYYQQRDRSRDSSSDSTSYESWNTSQQNPAIQNFLNQIHVAESPESLDKISTAIARYQKEQEFSDDLPTKQDGEPGDQTRWQKLRQRVTLNPRNWRCWHKLRLRKQPEQEEISIPVNPTWIEALTKHQLLDEVVSAGILVEPCNSTDHEMSSIKQGRYEYGYNRPVDNQELFTQSAIPYNNTFARLPESESLKKTLHQGIEQGWVEQFVQQKLQNDASQFNTLQDVQNFLTWKKSFLTDARDHHFSTMNVNNKTVDEKLNGEALYQAITKHEKQKQQQELEIHSTYYKDCQRYFWHPNLKTSFTTLLVGVTGMGVLATYFAMKK